MEEISDQRDGAIEKGIAMEMELSKCRVQLRVLSWELSKRSSETSIGDDFSSSFSDRGTDPAS